MLVLLIAGALLGIALRFQLNYNGLHLDEANYLFIGKQFLDGLNWPTTHYVFSSDVPFAWLALWDALLPGFGGRAGALVAGLLALVAWFGLICALFRSREERLVAAFLLLSQPTITSISRLATYDIISFALLGLALWVSKVASDRAHLRWDMMAGACLAAAVLAKYVTIVFLPIVIAAWWLKSTRPPWTVGLVIGIILGAYVWINFGDLHRLYEEQLVGAHAANSTILELLNIAILPLWPMVFAVLTLVFVQPESARSKTVVLLVAGASALLLYHLVFQDRVALYKHLAYSSAFLSILAVWLWQSARSAGAGVRFFLLLLLCAHVANAFQWNRDFERAWPDTRSIALSVEVNNSTEILSENAYLFRSALQGQISLERLHDTTYADLDKDGQFDEAELMQAIDQGRFSHVYLDGMTTPQLSQRLIYGPLNKNYVLVHFESARKLSGLDHSGTGLYSALFERVPQ